MIVQPEGAQMKEVGELILGCIGMLVMLALNLSPIFVLIYAAIR